MQREDIQGKAGVGQGGVEIETGGEGRQLGLESNEEKLEEEMKRDEMRPKSV